MVPSQKLDSVLEKQGKVACKGVGMEPRT